MKGKRRQTDKNISQVAGDKKSVSADDVNMAEDSTYREALKLLFLCVLWYFFSSANGILGKIVLSDFPYPMTVSMVQLISISAYLYPVIKVTNVPDHPMPTRQWFSRILPLAFGKFLASFSGHISLWKVPVSYAHTGNQQLTFFMFVEMSF